MSARVTKELANSTGKLSKSYPFSDITFNKILFSIFKNKMKAIEMCTNRFDLDTKTSFLDLYTKIDGGEDVSSWSSSGDLEPEIESDDDEDSNINY